MFAAIYFAQVPFAALPFIAVVPPPPPPPPPVEVVEDCERFAIGRCIGTEGGRGGVPYKGRAICVPTPGRAIGTSGPGTTRSC